jgi:formylglycine-generating enzyme required for sulfatase activity
MSGTMRKVVPLVVISALALAPASCSLFVSLDDLNDGNAGLVSACDSGSCDGAATNLDSSADAPATETSTVDAGINPCLGEAGTAGPRMIQADGYCIDSTEVTVAQYMQFVGDASAATGQSPVCAWNSITFAPATDGTGDPRCTPANVDPIFRGDFPITCVNWCDAYAYCDWAGKRLCGTIGGGSVPFDSLTTSSSQWFLACASTANDTFPNDSNDGGNCVLNQSASVPVGTTQCNGGYPGLVDMVGNVEEWVDSCDENGETDGGGTSVDRCHAMGDEFGENFSGPGCRNTDYDTRNETWAGIGFRCCSK